MIEQTLAGKYHVLRELGKGGFGQTYLANDLLLPDKQQCVVKQFKPSSDIPTEAFEQAKRSFEREATTLNIIGREHPQIPRLLAYFEGDGQFFLIQEYIEGHDLDLEIKEGQQLEEAQVINIVTEILEILAFVHSKNIIHRDIKPSNIMRRKEDGKLFLIDFGTVKQQIPTQMVTDEGQTVSKFAFHSRGYTPSEQLRLKPKLASDVYALGMMGIFALTGIPPFEISDDAETGELKWRDRIKVNSQFADVIDKMVRQDYRQRYSSAQEALEALKGVNEASIIPPEDKLKSLLIKAAAITSLLLILGSGGYYSWQKFKTPSLLTYENTEYGFDVDYPQNWVLKTVEDPFGTVARFHPSQSNAENTVVTLEVVPADTSTSLDEYNNLAIGQIIEYLPEARIINSQQIELNNKPAHRVVYTGKKNNSDFTSKYLQVWFQEGDEILILTYVAPEDKYQEYSETVEQTIIPSLVGRKVES